MYTLRVRNPISLHISVFQKNTGSFRVTSGPWHKLFHTVLVAMVTSKAILPFCSIGSSSQAHLVNEFNCIFTPQVHFPERNFISIVYLLLYFCTNNTRKSIDIGLCEQAPASCIETLFVFFSFSGSKRVYRSKRC